VTRSPLASLTSPAARADADGAPGRARPRRRRRALHRHAAHRAGRPACELGHRPVPLHPDPGGPTHVRTDEAGGPGLFDGGDAYVAHPAPDLRSCPSAEDRLLRRAASLLGWTRARSRRRSGPSRRRVRDAERATRAAVGAVVPSAQPRSATRSAEERSSPATVVRIVGIVVVVGSGATAGVRRSGRAGPGRGPAALGKMGRRRRWEADGCTASWWWTTRPWSGPVCG
jgi:hypothetical protein